MTIGDLMIDPELAAEWVLDNALDADHDDRFAGDDPPADWFPEPMPGEDEQAVRSAGASRAGIPFSDESPF